MATRVWNGSANDGNWGTAANWSAATVPVNGDTAIFNDGAVSVTAGLNQSAVSLELLLISSNYRGKIGSSGSLLQIDVAASGTSKLAFAGGPGSELWWTGAGNIIFVDTDTLGMVDLTATGTVPILAINKGTVAVHGGTFTAFYAGYRTSVQTDAAVTFTAGTITTAYCSGGMVTSPQTPTTLFCSGGVFRWTATSGTITNAYVASGTLNWRGTGQTVTNLYLIGGALLCESVGAGTVTNSTVAHPASSINVKGGSRMTFTNATRMIVSNVAISVEAGSTLAVAA